MKIAFNPTGTHIQHDALKVRLDFYPDPTDKTYVLHYVYVPVFPPEGYPGKVGEDGSPLDQKDYDKWVASLPRIWQLNPCVCVFVKVPSDIGLTTLTEFVGDVYPKDTVATLDEIMIQPNSAHLLTPFMRDKVTLADQKVTTTDIEAINSRLSGLAIDADTGGTVTLPQPESIAVGSAAIDRAGFAGVNYTYILKDNPANATGSITQIETWLVTASTAFEVASFFLVSGTNFSTRDSETIGAVSSGSKQTFSGLDMDITSGDYIGYYGGVTNGQVERDTSGGSGYWYGSPDLIPCTNNTFTSYATRDLSLYGTGTEGGAAAYIPRIIMG